MSRYSLELFSPPSTSSSASLVSPSLEPLPDTEGQGGGGGGGGEDVDTKEERHGHAMDVPQPPPKRIRKLRTLRTLEAKERNRNRPPRTLSQAEHMMAVPGLLEHTMSYLPTVGPLLHLARGPSRVTRERLSRNAECREPSVYSPAAARHICLRHPYVPPYRTSLGQPCCYPSALLNPDDFLWFIEATGRQNQVVAVRSDPLPLAKVVGKNWPQPDRANAETVVVRGHLLIAPSTAPPCEYVLFAEKPWEGQGEVKQTSLVEGCLMKAHMRALWYELMRVAEQNRYMHIFATEPDAAMEWVTSMRYHWDPRAHIMQLSEWRTAQGISAEELRQLWMFLLPEEEIDRIEERLAALDRDSVRALLGEKYGMQPDVLANYFTKYLLGGNRPSKSYLISKGFPSSSMHVLYPDQYHK